MIVFDEPGLVEAERAAKSMASAKVGVNFVGHIGSNAGLGVSARSFMRTLMERGHPVAMFDIDIGLHRSASALPAGVHRATRPEELPHRINLICLAMQNLPALLWRRHPTLLESRFFNAPIVFWELPAIPRLWVDALRLCDAMVSCSPCVQMALQRHLPNMPNVYAEHPLFLPKFERASRKDLGLSDSAVVFGASFDLGGDPARKNPGAIVRAFQMAFPGAEDVGLLIKANGSLGKESGHPAFSEIREAASRDSRIRFLAATLPYEEVLGLYASCDAYVSLHRGEGFGLGLIEAMALGKPVIATAYSGNMAFMTVANSFPIRYRLIPTASCYWQYSRAFVGRGAYWAEADVRHAAEVLRRLAQDAPLRTRIGMDACKEIQARQEVARRAEFVDELAALAETPCASRRSTLGRWKLAMKDVTHPHLARLRLRRLLTK